MTATGHPPSPALEMRDVHVRFGSVAALDGASITVRPGTVHALLGENGAGKTTLMRVAYGMLSADRGVLRASGRELHHDSPSDALRNGIGMVHQHFALVEAMTVAENVALGGHGSYDGAKAAARVASVAAASGLVLDPHARVDTLSIGARQRVEIVKALARDAGILILDEPTSVLPPSEAADLLRWVRDFATGTRCAVLITHRLRDALEVADDVTVLRNGRTVLARPARETTPEVLAAAMLGDVTATAPESLRQPPPGGGAVVVEARDLSVRDESGATRVRHANFELHAGEIVALAGIEGAGQGALMRALSGRLAAHEGKLRLPGLIGYIPEDRQRDALVLDMTLAENIALRGAATRQGWIRGHELETRTARLLLEHDVRAPGPRLLAINLSGGNQQKLVLARELDPVPELLVAENPARGLDVRAARAVQSRLREVADRGTAVVVTSNDLEELVALADRALVIHGGTVTAVPLDVTAIGRAMVGA